MKTINVNPEDVINILKRACYLAWKASGVCGMGFLQDRGEQSEDQVFNNIVTDGDYPVGLALKTIEDNSIYADYVFGRMMKLRLEYDRINGTIKFGDNKLTPDYQSWCRKYKTYEDLIQAAIESLK